MNIFTTTTRLVVFIISLSIPLESHAWEFIHRNRGDQRDDNFGYYIEGIGDQNSDGYDDILVYHRRLQEFQMFYGGDPMDTLVDWSVHGLWGGENVGDLNNDSIPEFFIFQRIEEGEYNYSIFFYIIRWTYK